MNNGSQTGPLSISTDDVLVDMEKRWNDVDRGNRRTWKETYSSATLSTTNLKFSDLCANQGLRGDKLATNRLSYRMAEVNIYSLLRTDTA